jgi:hypothetical protein
MGLFCPFIKCTVPDSAILSKNQLVAGLSLCG